MSPSRGGRRIVFPSAARRRDVARPPLGPVLSAVAFAALAGRAGAFHDDDCEFAAKKAGALIDWVALRDRIGAGEAAGARQLVEQFQGQEELAKAQCPLGAAAGCVHLAVEARDVDAIGPCLAGLDVLTILSSRWPIFKQLGEFQKLVPATYGSCDDLAHPSIDWAFWREVSIGFAEKVPPWLDGVPDSGPEGFNDAMGEAAGIVWKASSGAVAQGITIAEWTNQCAAGVLSAYLIQCAGRVLGGGDVYRIVERPIAMARWVLTNPEDVLYSPWPLFGILHTLSCMKLALHDTRFAPWDLTPLAGEVAEDVAADEAARSKTWRSAAAALRRAGAASSAVGDGQREAAPQVILLTLLPMHRLDFLMNFFKHMDRLDLTAPLAVIPGRENITEPCEIIAAGFAQKRPERVLADWSPCLPFVSQFAHRAQFLYMHVALQLGMPVFWFDFHVVWQRSPLTWARQALSATPPPLPYQQDCWDDACHTPMELPEVYVAEEFYQKHWPRNSLLLLRPTLAVKSWLEMFARWLCKYPYAVVSQGLHYVVYPEEPDIVPGLSMLPAPASMPRVVLGQMNTEQEFVSFDGWFGFFDQIMSVEVGGFIQESDRSLLLDKMLMGDAEETQKVMMAARKMLSPKRPTQRLYERFFIGGEYTPCHWERVPNAFIGGYASDVDTIFASEGEARCECLFMGSQCGGITCEAGEAEGSVACTVRQAEVPLQASPYGEDTYVKRCTSGGCDAPQVERIVHVNFADGCCEAEQNQSSETAMQFGAHESRPLRGDFLDEDFRRKNHHLLTFNRTPELTQHKTPSGKIGYYVWKPYVVLRTVLDPELPWDTTVVVWTDAGIHFVSDVRPLIRKYLRSSDVAATRTPMLEGDFSKRDAFVLLDADYQSIMETNQIATGIILVRKTKLAVQFLERWLLACEEPRIMTEEPSVLGMPDYYSYKNNNDDQTAFSLLFKRHGFEAFSVGERDEVVYTGRNLAKFIKASDDFALGVKTDRENWLQAADDAAKQRRSSGDQ